MKNTQLVLNLLPHQSFVLTVATDNRDLLRRVFRSACANRRWIVPNTPGVYIANIIRHLAGSLTDGVRFVGPEEAQLPQALRYTFYFAGRTAMLKTEVNDLEDSHEPLFKHIGITAPRHRRTQAEIYGKDKERKQREIQLYKEVQQRKRPMSERDLRVRQSILAERRKEEGTPEPASNTEPVESGGRDWEYFPEGKVARKWGSHTLYRIDFTGCDLDREELEEVPSGEQS